MVRMSNNRKVYMQPSLLLYSVASDMILTQHSTPAETPPLVDNGEGGDPAEGLAKGFDFNNIVWYNVNDVGDRITKEFGIDTNMWYE